MSRGILIPLIESNKLIVVEHEGFTHLYYGLTENRIDKHLLAQSKIEEYINDNNLGEGNISYDFMNGTQSGSKRWFYYEVNCFQCLTNGGHKLNVYEDGNCSPESSLIKDNNGEYERVYWYQQKSK